MANEISTAGFQTGLIKLQDRYQNMIATQMADHRITMDPYQKICLMNAISAIQKLLTKKGLNMGDATVDQTSLTEALLAVSALKLNAVASPREVYFLLRNTKKADGNYVQAIEMGVEGDGNDAILRRFGADIKTVGQYTIIYEGDEFKPPEYNGMDVTPPKYIPKEEGDRAIAVMYPIVKTDESIQYHVAYRSRVKPNLLAHISNNMMKETFGICTELYTASNKQKAEVAAKKHKILTEASIKTLDEILADESLFSWISPAWREPQSKELMIIRKMRNNIVKKIPKDFGTNVTATSYDGHEDDDEGMRDITPSEDAKDEPAPTMEITAEEVKGVDKAKSRQKPASIPESELPTVPLADEYGELIDEPDVFANADKANSHIGF